MVADDTKDDGVVFHELLRQFRHAWSEANGKGICDVLDSGQYQEVLQAWCDAGKPTPCQAFIQANARSALKSLLYLDVAQKELAQCRDMLAVFLRDGFWVTPTPTVAAIHGRIDKAITAISLAARDMPSETAEKPCECAMCSPQQPSEQALENMAKSDKEILADLGL